MVKKRAQPLDQQILSRFYGAGRGSVFHPNSFLHLGRRSAIDQALSRLTAKGRIRRLARGLYDYPKVHPVLHQLAPNPDLVAKALAGKHGIRLQPSGAYAANLLGLSEQVPAKIVFLTDGPSKAVQIGNQQIHLKRTTPKNMQTAGRTSGVVIQALRYLGKEHINERIVEILKQKLSPQDKRRLLEDIRFAPSWMAALFRDVAVD
jgi:hypothetical protein